ncbi:MAG: Cell wall-associated hydrolases (invasion-associated proteins) [Hydrogenibacillus schlegelii]|uniref:Cell wall-associated hydrolases (Invasion-associated proteins) n=1 Tax=Hydrogenibacillus schlegelii TaxID=1484 RepID=A0A2T5GCI1_HYDSH|nr:C40 family peptidase [Hydrogenibacillus schlegelii]PTQ53886.1 MAG: Cell wall-associated hydrolases (invasion-associated proteins) [Hydrogenibacillus schlegelii]
MFIGPARTARSVRAIAVFAFGGIVAFAALFGAFPPLAAAAPAGTAGAMAAGPSGAPAAPAAPSAGTAASSVPAAPSAGAATPSAAAAAPAAVPLRFVLAEKAQAYLGVPYRFGATYDRDGSGAFDCSAFVERAYADVGIDIPRTTAKQAAFGRPVAKSQLLIGDLVFFTTRKDRKMNHVGLYLGRGRFIHASPAGGRGVQISSLTSGYWKDAFLYARRIDAVFRAQAQR